MASPDAIPLDIPKTEEKETPVETTPEEVQDVAKYIPRQEYDDLANHYTELHKHYTEHHAKATSFVEQVSKREAERKEKKRQRKEMKAYPQGKHKSNYKVIF